MATDCPIGINLGLEHFTTAYITSKDEVLTIASIESSQEWKAFFLDTLRVKRDREEQGKYVGENKIEELISSTLADIRQSTEIKLGRSVHISFVSYPEHFKGVPYVSALLDAIRKVYPEVKDGYNILGYLNSVRLAYGLNNPKALGYPKGVNLDDYNSVLLHFDYQKDFLEVSIMSVGEYSDIRERCFRIDDFGGSENIALPGELADLKGRFQSLLDDQIRDNRYCPTDPEDFRFIIFSGEVAFSEFEKIRKTFVEAVPEFENRFLHDIDPFWVGAVGVANYARNYILKPPYIPSYYSGEPFPPGQSSVPDNSSPKEL